MSHEVLKSISRAIGLPWNEHCAGSAWTITLFFACAAASSGLAALVSAWNSGKKVSAASRQPAMMIGFLPILSESVPKTMKNGVPMSSDAPIISCAVVGSTLSCAVRKNSA